MSMNNKELQDWRDEVDADYRKAMDELEQRIKDEDPLDMGLHLGRQELASHISSLEAVSICLGQVIRGKRL